MTWPSGAIASQDQPNCGPVAFHDGVLVYNSINRRGIWDCYRSTGNGGVSVTAPGWPLVYTHRGGSSVQGDLLLIVAARTSLPSAIPGKGAGNDIVCLNLATGQVTALVTGRPGIIWACWHPTLPRIVWSQMTKTALQAPPVGQWQIHTADIVSGQIANEVTRSDLPAAFYETYGWDAVGESLLFASSMNAAAGQTNLYTMPDQPGATPTPLLPSPASWREFMTVAPAGAFDDGHDSLVYSWATGTLQSFALGLELYRLDLTDGASTRLTYFQPPINAGVCNVIFDPANPKRILTANKASASSAQLTCFEVMLP